MHRSGPAGAPSDDLKDRREKIRSDGNDQAAGPSLSTGRTTIEAVHRGHMVPSLRGSGGNGRPPDMVDGSPT